MPPSGWALLSQQMTQLSLNMSDDASASTPGSCPASSPCSFLCCSLVLCTAGVLLLALAAVAAVWLVDTVQTPSGATTGAAGALLSLAAGIGMQACRHGSSMVTNSYAHVQALYRADNHLGCVMLTSHALQLCINNSLLSDGWASTCS